MSFSKHLKGDLTTEIGARTARFLQTIRKAKRLTIERHSFFTNSWERSFYLSYGTTFCVRHMGFVVATPLLRDQRADEDESLNKARKLKYRLSNVVRLT